jgi:hypothetical protein
MTPHEWLIKEYQRKATLLERNFDSDDEKAEYLALIETVNIQPLVDIKQDHWGEECRCETLPGMDNTFIACASLEDLIYEPAP